MESTGREFEIHITVAPGAEGATRLRSFCAERGLKCTHIVLSRGVTPQQPMLSCRRTGTRSEIDAEVATLAEELRKIGLDPVRIKLECSPLDEGVPQSDDEAVGDSRYFEHHVKLLLHPAESVAPLEAISERHGAHLSRNAFKRHGDGQEERFVTLRCFHVGRLRAERQLADLLSDLRLAGFVILDIESEFSLFDSRLELDAGWLAAPLSVLLTEGARMWNWLKKVVAAADPDYRETEVPVATTVGTLAAARRAIVAEVFSSPYRENYVLRGSVLLRYWLPGPAREPNDIDLVTAYPHDPDRCTREILEIFRRSTGEEDIAFSLHPENILPMWEYDVFPGVRFHIPWAKPGGKRENTQLDVAFDNTPPLPGEWIDLDFHDGRLPVPVRAWTPEACLASKIGWIATDSEDFGWPDDDDLLDTRLLASLDGLKIDRLHESLRLLLQGRQRDLTLFDQFDLRLQTALDWPPGSEDRLEDFSDRFFPWQQHRNIFRWLRSYVETALAIAPLLRGFVWLPDRDDFALMNKLRNEPGVMERLTPEERERHDRLRETAPAKWQGALFPRQNR